MSALPIDALMPALLDALSHHATVVLQAPPGAGKTTRVPLALLNADWRQDRRLLMLEPRRVAARNAAAFMARQLGESPGRTVGYRTRLDSRVSAATRIEVVTEGILTRLLQADPALSDYAAILFDEFHERSLQGDLGLALARESQQALREDLRLLVMSATLDGERLATALDAPLLQSEGRAWPVTVHYRPPGRQPWLEHLWQQLPRILAEEEGSVLVFLPGVGEIRRTVEVLSGHLPEQVLLAPLYGDQSALEQDRALQPAPPGLRKLVLATAIAETSLTIEGVRVVVDAGWQRRARFDPPSGTTRLVTERVSAASAIQRAGRAGRLESGVCHRLWAESERLAEFTPPEILTSDLSGLWLELAAWGCRDATTLFWLDPPPAAATEQARALLQRLGALGPDGALTSLGRTLHDTGLPVRQARLWQAGLARGQAPLAAALAALLSEQDLFRGSGRHADLLARLELLRRPGGDARVQRVRQVMQRLTREPLTEVPVREVGALLALAWPDRVARRRAGDAPRYQLSNGRGARLEETDPLAAEPWLVVADLDGQQREGRIDLAAPLDPSMLEEVLPEQLQWQPRLDWDERTESVLALEEHRLGALVLAQRPLARVSAEQKTRALLSGVRRRGLECLPWTAAARQLRARLTRLHALMGDDWPAMDDDTLLATLEDWCLPWLSGASRLSHLQALSVQDALWHRLTPAQQQMLNRWLPTMVTVPTGRAVSIDYAAEGDPVLAVKLQELFGLQQLPRLCEGRLPLCVHLLSPAGRPAAITRDLARFWQEGYVQVRKELRGRYPRHPWPEDPLAAVPTRRTKPRGT